MIGREGIWKKVTVTEARALQDEHLIWWRPEMLAASSENPQEDPAFILEGIQVGGRVVPIRQPFAPGVD